MECSHRSLCQLHLFLCSVSECAVNRPAFLSAPRVVVNVSAMFVSWNIQVYQVRSRNQRSKCSNIIYISNSLVYFLNDLEKQLFISPNESTLVFWSPEEKYIYFINTHITHAEDSFRYLFRLNIFEFPVFCTKLLLNRKKIGFRISPLCADSVEAL